MADDPSKFVTLKYEDRGRKIIKKVKIYFEKRHFPKGSEKHMANIIDKIMEDPKKYLHVIDSGGSEEIVDDYGHEEWYQVKRYMTPALFVTK